MYEGTEFFAGIRVRFYILVDRIDEAGIRQTPAHASYISVCVRDALPVRIVPLDIESSLISLIFAAFEEIEDLVHIFKPFVVVKVQEPFAFCGVKPCVPGFGKIIAPGKWNNM